ncbi:acyltransferase family protein [Paraburkholderia acidisoli]|uniref:Acyltransferase family protein n=1 Tax=Paraburkholderia acidisoli TaxID=2571748 RepID=A0A7Z2GR35_9BURK|nr:acyltransferase [Paraburkholderia acidisoli]QGZ66421.1 acyltransferase family protein [Paraburkholderia acidisoli]
MRQPGSPPRYATLDGLRGAAALVVVLVHFPYLFQLHRTTHGYLAVDLFFAMSGFVIGSAYDRKLRSGALDRVQYATLRLIRLYPLYLAGLVLGTLALAMRLPVSDWPLIASALPTGVLMLPFPAAMRTLYPWPGVQHYFYPLDFPAWSLFFELLASVSYGVWHRYLGTRVLLAIMAICAFALTVAAFTSGIDGGALWPTFHLGFARVGYAFPAGLLLYRWHGGDAPSGTTSDAAAFAVVALAIGLLVAPVPRAWQAATNLALVLVALPAVVWAASRIEPSARCAPWFAFAGFVSYGIYVLHVPFAFLLQDLMTRQRWLPHPLGVTALALLPGVVLLAWCVERFFDVPVRRALLARAFWLSAQPLPPASAGSAPESSSPRSPAPADLPARNTP